MALTLRTVAAIRRALMPIRKLILRCCLTVCLWLATVPAIAQPQLRYSNAFEGSELQTLENGVREGDLQSLYLCGNYLDSSRVVVTYLGYHRMDLPLNLITLRILEENTLFTEAELPLSNALGAREFHRFIDSNRDRIRFSRLSAMFLITGEAERNSKYRLDAASAAWLETAAFMLNSSLLKADPELRQALKSKEPEALLAIASRWYRQRGSWNITYFGNELLAAALSIRTGLEISVPDSRGNFLTHRGSSDEITAQNHWFYWAAHYRDYQWSDSAQRFLNLRERPIPANPIQEDIERLNNDSLPLAQQAMLRLAEAEPAALQARLRTSPEPPMNHRLGLHPATLLTLATLTKYCRETGFPYKDVPLIDQLRDSLRRCPPYPRGSDGIERYGLALIKPELVTALEFSLMLQPYWAEGGGVLSRILDRCYGRDWAQITGDDRLLLLYLKKSGVLQHRQQAYYASRFWQAPDRLLRRVDSLANRSGDADIVRAARTIRAIQAQHPEPRATRDLSAPGKPWNRHSRKELQRVVNRLSGLNGSARLDAQALISELLAGTWLETLPDALNILANTPDSLYPLARTLLSDYGLSIPEPRNAFASFLREHSEREIYDYEVARSGVEIRDSNGDLDFSRIFIRLKYGETSGPFSYGSDDNIFPVIKLLEFHFGTRLGFPRKRCNGAGVWACRPDDQALAWMDYLQMRGLVPKVDPEPPSFKQTLDAPAPKR